MYSLPDTGLVLFGRSGVLVSEPGVNQKREKLGPREFFDSYHAKVQAERTYII